MMIKTCESCEYKKDNGLTMFCNVWFPRRYICDNNLACEKYRPNSPPSFTFRFDPFETAHIRSRQAHDYLIGENLQ